MLYNKSEYIETVRGGAWGPGGGVGLWARLGSARQLSLLPTGIGQQGEQAIRSLRQPKHRSQRQGKQWDGGRLRLSQHGAASCLPPVLQTAVLLSVALPVPHLALCVCFEHHTATLEHCVHFFAVSLT